MATSSGHNGHHQTISQKMKKAGIYNSYAATVSQLKICDFLGEKFKGFEEI
jgi:hypothetical protein